MKHVDVAHCFCAAGSLGFSVLSKLLTLSPKPKPFTPTKPRPRTHTQRQPTHTPPPFPSPQTLGWKPRLGAAVNKMGESDLKEIANCPGLFFLGLFRALLFRVPGWVGPWNVLLFPFCWVALRESSRGTYFCRGFKGLSCFCWASGI